MTTIATMLRKVESVNLRQEVPKIIQQTSFEIVAYNQAQLYSGITAKGERISPRYRSAPYAQEKAKMNSKPGLGIPDLRLTGAFYSSINVTVENEKIDIDSFSPRGAELKRKYGESILGLTESNRSKYANTVVFDGIKKYVSGKTGLKFS